MSTTLRVTIQLIPASDDGVRTEFPLGRITLYLEAYFDSQRIPISHMFLMLWWNAALVLISKPWTQRASLLTFRSDHTRKGPRKDCSEMAGQWWKCLHFSRVKAPFLVQEACYRENSQHNHGRADRIRQLGHVAGTWIRVASSDQQGEHNGLLNNTSPPSKGLLSWRGKTMRFPKLGWDQPGKDKSWNSSGWTRHSVVSQGDRHFSSKFIDGSSF